MVKAPVRWVASRYGLTRGASHGLSVFSIRPLFTIHQPIMPCMAPRLKNRLNRPASAHLTLPRATKTASGRTKYTPRPRPHIRWPYSIQYMNLYSSTVMLALVLWNSGDCLYFANSRVQSAALSGGCSQLNFQSVMDRPLRVSRVMPPSTTMLYTHRHPPTSHTPTWRCAATPPFTSGCANVVAVAAVAVAAVAASDTAATAAEGEEEEEYTRLVATRAACSASPTCDFVVAITAVAAAAAAAAAAVAVVVVVKRETRAGTRGTRRVVPLLALALAPAAEAAAAADAA
mmetsp:Transcript_6149/g.15254  ORF Transcript_6149/g.15254 Transcript_6149/m.15254 type:complete len:288 (-) Transcript_6149:441-1304(-)